MVSLLFAARILVIVGMYYALRKGRKDWLRLFFVILILLTSVGYSLDGNWVWAALEIAVMAIVICKWLVKRKSN